jgi:hypothetical protein
MRRSCLCAVRYSLSLSVCVFVCIAQVDKQTGGHYPAPYAILASVKEGMEKGLAAGLKKEAHEFARLGRTPQSKSLVSIFFAQTALKKNRYGRTRPSAGAWDSARKFLLCVYVGLSRLWGLCVCVCGCQWVYECVSVSQCRRVNSCAGFVRNGLCRFGKPTQTYNTLAVIGAGLMGAGVAQVSVERDFRVILKVPASHLPTPIHTHKDTLTQLAIHTCMHTHTDAKKAPHTNMKLTWIECAGPGRQVAGARGAASVRQPEPQGQEAIAVYPRA